MVEGASTDLLSLRAMIAAVAGREVTLDAEVVGRLLGGDDDRAADRVAAIKRALRPTQHLDLLHVEQVAGELARDSRTAGEALLGRRPPPASDEQGRRPDRRLRCHIPANTP